MTQGGKIALGVGGVVILGVGIYFATRKEGQSSSTTTTTTYTGGGGQQDPTTNTVDSLGTTLGNIISDIWATTQNNKDKGCNYTGPADPYTAEVNQSMSSDDVKALQTRLSGCNTDIAAVITGSGGVDGVLGPGTKNAYNMARKACCINNSGQLIT